MRNILYIFTITLLINSGAVSAANVESYIQAESRIVTLPMEVRSDSDAFGGKYVGVPEGQRSSYNTVSTAGVKLSINVPSTKKYTLWMRIKAPNGKSNSFYLLLDGKLIRNPYTACLLYTSDAADERSSVDLGGRRIIKKKNNEA